MKLNTEQTVFLFFFWGYGEDRGRVGIEIEASMSLHMLFFVLSNLFKGFIIPVFIYGYETCLVVHRLLWLACTNAN